MESYFSVPSIPWASYFRADHSIVLSVYPLGELFLYRPSLGESAGYLILHPLASYFNVYHITPHPSIPLMSYFCAIHPLGELFLCQPFNCLIRLSLWRVIFPSSIPWASYFRVDHLILHPLASYFNVYHITLHPSIPLASYFCAIHHLGKLFSCRPYNSPLILLASYFCAVHPLVELFSCLPFISPSFAELFFMPII